MEETNAEKFIQLFKELELAARVNYGLSDWESVTHYLSKREDFYELREKIKYCGNIRNILQHSAKIEGEYPIEPSSEVLDLLKEITDLVRNRKKCSQIMIPREKVFCKRVSDRVLKTLPAMKNASHNHVPILEGRDKVVGVFTAVSFLRLVADSGDSVKSHDPTFREISEYTAFNHHLNETYVFVSGDEYVDELRDLFEKLYSNGQRLSMAFVTGNGKRNGRLLGIITPWDLLRRERP